MNVGWGKKETQFHGTEGKEARARQAERGHLSPQDKGRVRVVWRGDGQMLAVSYVTAGQEPVRNVFVAYPFAQCWGICEYFFRIRGSVNLNYGCGRQMNHGYYLVIFVATGNKILSNTRR
jgi:hypothetical protein